GLQYKVIKEGSGPTPKTNQTVSVHYRGTLTDGKEFDSSIKRGEPATFPVTGVIKGWTEALLMMKTGSKWELTIPAELAYGEMGQRDIPPNSVLNFEVELISIKPAPDESVHAVSGEIIKVPSKAELDKGAKIEVIQPGSTNSSATNSKPKIN
ncbi:MAG: FKBP-type peptidyl-prolyl cis-trans isomerase, partial [Limisphaerales bacterium]